MINEGNCINDSKWKQMQKYHWIKINCYDKPIIKRKSKILSLFLWAFSVLFSWIVSEYCKVNSKILFFLNTTRNTLQFNFDDWASFQGYEKWSIFVWLFQIFIWELGTFVLNQQTDIIKLVEFEWSLALTP